MIQIDSFLGNRVQNIKYILFQLNNRDRLKYFDEYWILVLKDYLRVYSYAEHK